MESRHLGKSSVREEFHMVGLPFALLPLQLGDYRLTVHQEIEGGDV